ncbi:putative outer membrane protein A [hydrothermal vent metagenome]|uniref:Putative outer membrane protein A n=1 Tax=hydrothermal vent metagenome TaxID=652676 RepID=A0A1W1BB37_9ZZZZ
MKNIVLSATAIFALSSFAIAGGGITPIEEPAVEVPAAVAPITDEGFYLGLGYGYLNATIDYDIANLTVNALDDSFGEIMLQAGYKFNQYVAVEGRYWFAVSNGSFLNPGGRSGVAGEVGDDLDIDGWGIYVKPMYPVTEAFDVYALLGFGGISYTLDNGNWFDYTDDSQTGFSWGLGVSFDFTENVSAFVDYVTLYDDTNSYVDPDLGNIDEDTKIDTINVGITYKF